MNSAWLGLVAMLIVAVPTVCAAHDEGDTTRSPDLAPGESWSLVFAAAGQYHYHSHHTPGAEGMVEVRDGAPPAAEVRLTLEAFSPPTVAVAPGGLVTWTNAANVTMAVAFPAEVPSEEPHGYTQIHGYVIGLLVGGAVLGLVLVAYGMRAFRRTGNAAMACVAGAFTLFALKNALVAWSLHLLIFPHEYLELIDAAGDLGTVLLLVAPIFWARPR